jgi:hypothetical protein
MNIRGCVPSSGPNRILFRGNCIGNELGSPLRICRRGANGVNHKGMWRHALLPGCSDRKLLHIFRELQ